MTQQNKPLNDDFDNSGDAKPTAATQALQKVSMDSMLAEAAREDREVANIEESGPRTVKYSQSTDFDEGDYAYLRLKLGQPGTPEVGEQLAKAGQYIVTGFPAMTNVTAVPLGWGKSRDYSYGEPRVTYCTSVDGKVGKGDNGEGEGRHDCSVCPQAQWRKNPNPNVRKNLPPACSEQFNFVLYLPELSMPVEYRMQKTAIAMAKAITGRAKAVGWGGFAISLGSTKKTNEKSPNGFYIPVLSILMEPEDPIEADRYNALLTTARTLLVEDEAEEDLEIVAPVVYASASDANTVDGEAIPI